MLLKFFFTLFISLVFPASKYVLTITLSCEIGGIFFVNHYPSC